MNQEEIKFLKDIHNGIERMYMGYYSDEFKNKIEHHIDNGCIYHFDGAFMGFIVINKKGMRNYNLNKLLND